MSEIADSPAILRSTSQEVSVLRGKFGTVSDRMLAWWFITPTILLLLAINIFPLIWTVYLSFTNFKANRANRGVEWIGLANYRRILSDSDVWAAMQVTAHFVFWSILLQVVLGFGLALLLDKRFRGHGLWTTIILLPMMLSPAVVGTFWSFLFQPQIGLFNTIVGFFTGIDPSSFQMIGDVPLAPWAIVLVDTWMWTPYVLLICLAGLRSIPDYIYEAAEIDRASAWRQFWSITVPMVLPFLMLAVLFRHRKLQDVRHGKPAHLRRAGIDDRGGLDHVEAGGVREMAHRLLLRIRRYPLRECVRCGEHLCENP